MISFNMGRLYRSSYQNKNAQLEKLKGNELKIEDILEDDDLVSEVKTNHNSEFAEFFSSEVIRQLIDYATKMPKADEVKIGHKFPYNACEILCSENSFILDRLFDCIKIQLEENDSESKKDSDDSQMTEESDEKSESSKTDHNNESCGNGTNLEEKANEKVEYNNNLQHEDSTKDNNLNRNENSQDNSNNKTEIELQTLMEKQHEANETSPEIKIQTDLEIIPNTNEQIKATDDATNNSIPEDNENKATVPSLIENYLDDKPKSETIPTSTFNNEKSEEEQETVESNIKDSKQEKEEDDDDDEDEIEIDYNPEKRKSLPRHKKNPPITSDFFKEECLEETLNVSQAISINKEEDIGKYKLIYETLDYFYIFLESTLPLDYVLVGYFYKVFNHLLNSRTDFLNYIFKHRPEILDNLTTHLNRKAIGECLHKILTSKCEGIEAAQEMKLNLVHKLITIIKEEKSLEKVEIITDLIQECMNNKRFYEMFMSNLSLLRDLNQILHEDKLEKEVSRCLIKLLIRINEFIKKEFGTSVTPTFTSDNHYEIYSLLTMDSPNSLEDAAMNLHNSRNEEFINTILGEILNIYSDSTLKIIDDFIKEEQVQKLDTTYDKQVKRVGTLKLIELEYVRSVIDIIINTYASNVFQDTLDAFIRKVIDKKFFPKLTEDFYTYEFNSYFQRLFEEVIILSVNEHSPMILIQHLFAKDGDTNCNFLHSLVEHIDQDLFFVYNSGSKISSGLYGVLCEIINYITSSHNAHLREIISKDDEFQFFVSTFIEPSKKLFSKKLLLKGNFETNEEGFSHLEDLNEKINEVNENEALKEEEMYTSKSLKEIFNDAYDLLEKRRNPNFQNEIRENYNPIEEDCAFQLETRDKSIEYITNPDIPILEKEHETYETDELKKDLTREESDTTFYDNLYWGNEKSLDEKMKRDLIRELEEL